jgi:hypothetical protein
MGDTSPLTGLAYANGALAYANVFAANWLQRKMARFALAAFVGVNGLISDFCQLAETVVASEMSLPVGGSGNRTLLGGRGAAGGSQTVPRGAGLEGSWREPIYGRGQRKGFAEAVACPVAGTHLSEAEYAQFEKSAARRGLTTGEWCRQMLLEAAVASPAQEPEAEVILPEILALRKIVINLLYGEKAGAPLSEERMRLADRDCRLGKAAQSSGAPARRTDSTSWSLER